MAKIRLVLQDFDGCVLRQSDLTDLQNTPPEQKIQALIDRNSPLLGFIFSSCSDFDINFIGMGSNRQSFNVDFQNSYAHCKISAFPVIEAMSKHLGIELDPFLMSDIYGRRPDGDSFRAATALNSNDQPHANWFFDESKLTIIIANAHRVALRHHHTDSIVINLIDDDVNILLNLYEILTDNPNILPNNVTIRLYQFPTSDPFTTIVDSTLPPIQGTGEKRPQYKDDIFRMYQHELKRNPRRYKIPGLLTKPREISTEHEHPNPDVSWKFNAIEVLKSGFDFCHTPPDGIPSEKDYNTLSF